MLWKHGGNIVIRKSKYGEWSHVMWTMDFKEYFHYVPKNPPLPFPFIVKVLFKGKIKIDKKETLYNIRK